MIALALALVLSGGPIDSLSRVSLLGLSFKAPTTWVRETPDENSVEWAAPGDLAKLAVSVFPLEKPLQPEGCLKRMIEAVNKDSKVPFETFALDGQPAARKLATDYVGEGEVAKVDANKVTTTTLIGCNGRLKWLLTMSTKTAEGVRFGPISKRIIDSVAYGK
jgi:hypothetical protein